MLPREACSYILLCPIPSCKYMQTYSSILLVMGIWVFSPLGLLRTRLLSTFHAHCLVNKYTHLSREIELLEHSVDTYLVLKTLQFSKV